MTLFSVLQEYIYRIRKKGTSIVWKVVVLAYAMIDTSVHTLVTMVIKSIDQEDNWVSNAPFLKPQLLQLIVVLSFAFMSCLHPVKLMEYFL